MEGIDTLTTLKLRTLVHQNSNIKVKSQTTNTHTMNQ